MVAGCGWGEGFGECGGGTLPATAPSGVPPRSGCLSHTGSLSQERQVLGKTQYLTSQGPLIPSRAQAAPASTGLGKRKVLTCQDHGLRTYLYLLRPFPTHSSVLAWRIPGTGVADGLLSMGLHRVGHD